MARITQCDVYACILGHSGKCHYDHMRIRLYVQLPNPHYIFQINFNYRGLQTGIQAFSIQGMTKVIPNSQVCSTNSLLLEWGLGSIENMEVFANSIKAQ